MEKFYRVIFNSLFVLGVLMAMSSCVPNKQIVYLQNDIEPKVNTVTNKDSSHRTYATRFHEYVLRPHDIISVHVASLTPSEFDFVQKYEEDLGLIRKLNQYNQGADIGVGNQGGGGGGGVGVGTNLGGPTLATVTLDRLQTGFTINEVGTLELPKLGTLKFAGLTIPQAEKMVIEKLHGFYETPLVRIQLLSFHFTILGEVTKEGRYTIFEPNANVFDAISIANNLSEYADRSKLKIIRFENEKATVLYVNMLRENLLEQPGFFLQPNDLIIVPPLKARQTKKYTIPNYTVFIGIIVSAISVFLLVEALKK